MYIKKHLSISLKLTAFTILCTTLVGCADPYDKKLPADGRLTIGEAEKIAQTLTGSDQERFKNWAERILRKEKYGGEPSVAIVKHALLNQTEFEMRQQQALADIALKKAEQEEISHQKKQVQREKQAEIERISNQRAAVNYEIGKHFSAQALSYEFQPLFNRHGEEFARQWLFKLKLTNTSSKAIVGAVGWANISDVFGSTMGSYPMKIEPRVESGKSIEYSVIMDHDRKNPRHIAMTEAKTFMVNWFFESVAFSDGSIIDQKSMADSQGKKPTVMPASPLAL